MIVLRAAIGGQVGLRDQILHDPIEEVLPALRRPLVGGWLKMDDERLPLNEVHRLVRHNRPAIKMGLDRGH